MMPRVTEGRIIKGVGGQYHVVPLDNHNHVYICSARGRFRKMNITPLVGDIAVIEIKACDDGTAVITDIRERRNRLLRPRVANVDRVLLTFAAAEPVIDFSLCDRLIIMAEAAGIEPLIIINKIDLNDAYMSLISDYMRIGYQVFAVSTIGEEWREGIFKLSDALRGMITAFAGPSGVGKSSIINRLLSYNKMETGSLSQKIARGKHTTRHAELIPLSEVNEPGYVIDTPGFTAIEPEGINRGNLPRLFREFNQFIGLCRFDDCRHINEPGCAIKENIDKLISSRRYRQYVEIYNAINTDMY